VDILEREALERVELKFARLDLPSKLVVEELNRVRHA